LHWVRPENEETPNLNSSETPVAEFKSAAEFKKGHGGKREGAGRPPKIRPPETPTIPGAVFVPPARRKAGAPLPPSVCPAHIASETRAWFESVNRDFVLEPHHLRILRLACESWDRGQQAREALEAAGSLVYEDRFHAPHARPEIAIERDSRLAFARLVRELGLDVEAPGGGATTGRLKW
jgi:hypothetical protein